MGPWRIVHARRVLSCRKRECGSVGPLRHLESDTSRAVQLNLTACRYSIHADTSCSATPTAAELSSPRQQWHGVFFMAVTTYCSARSVVVSGIEFPHCNSKGI